MDKVTKALSDRVARLEQIIHTLQHAPRKHDGKPVSKADDTDRERDSVTESTPRLTDGNPGPVQTDDPKNKWYKSFSGWKTRLEIVAIFAGIGYAYVTYRQWHDLRHNFEVDQRVWLGVTEGATPRELHEGTVLNSTVILVNQGKTPAYNVVQQAGFRIMTAGGFPCDRVLNSTVILINQGKTPAYNVVQQAGFRIIKAGGPFDPAREVNSSALSPQGIIMPTGKRELSICTLGAIGQKRADELNSGEYRLYLFGRITYDDAFGKHHQTRFSMRMELGNQLSFSTYGNYDYAD